MNSTLYKSDTRGRADYGWLQTRYSFSFADYYDPGRMNFGVLRVLNDDAIAGGGGFPMHPHKNMEIVTIPLEGELEHSDSMGNKKTIRATDEKTEIQVMSAGRGITHSEYNKSSSEPLKLLQIWITPDKQSVEPRYAETVSTLADRHNKLQTIISPESEGTGAWLHQNVWFQLGKFDKGKSVEYKIKSKDNGLYVFIISGEVKVGEQSLNARDGLGLSDFEKINIKAENDCEILLMDIPMK